MELSRFTAQVRVERKPALESLVDAEHFTDALQIDIRSNSEVVDRFCQRIEASRYKRLDAAPAQRDRFESKNSRRVSEATAQVELDRFVILQLEYEAWAVHDARVQVFRAGDREIGTD